MTIKRIEIPIADDYVPDWGFWEGVREILQNAVDGETDSNAPFESVVQGNTLTVRNPGITMDARALLLGGSKKKRGRHVGRYGEGLKLSMIALLRTGRRVTVVTDREAWIPSFEVSEVFPDSRVLVVRVARRMVPSPEPYIEVRVKGILSEDLDLLRLRFLPFRDGVGRVSTAHGDILSDEAEKGNVYVRGIHVFKDEGFQHGYDLHEADLDRDRKVISRWPLQTATAKAWLSAVSGDPLLASRLLDLLSENAPDVEHATWLTIEDDVRASLNAERARRWGDSLLVDNPDMHGRAAAVGVSARIVARNVTSLFREDEASQRAIIEKAGEDGDDVEFADLDPFEREAFAAVTSAAERMGIVKHLPQMSVFKDSGRLFALHAASGAVRLSRRVLASPRGAVRAYLLAVAHAEASDGVVSSPAEWLAEAISSLLLRSTADAGTSG